MKLKHKKGSKLQNGITLIALVITIIVLLILAGVSIATLTGDNGILTKAQTAKEETQKASEEEQIKLAAMNAAMNTQGYKYDTEDGQKVPIPAGFAPTQIDGENSVKDGFVITDKNGNEFVWVPVTTKYERNQNFDKANIAQNDDDYLPDGIVVGVGGEESKETEIVKNAGGFYIGRYEAGAEGGILQKDEDGETYSWTETTKLVCKKGETVYNWISQPDIKTKAKTFINNNNVKSGLITGIQWDMTLAFIDGKIDGKGQIYDIKKASQSRHINILAAPSGTNEADRVCNIYDLEGNLMECTAERVVENASQTNDPAHRGGDHWNVRPASFRGVYGGARYQRPRSRF